MGNPSKKRVLIVCTGNACRSQMAEALWRHEAGDLYEVFSAGTHPAGVHRLAQMVIEELGIKTVGHYSKSVYELTGQTFDLVITVCDDAREICPVFHGGTRTLHWPFEDPVMSQGSIEERLPKFRLARDLMHQRIREFLKEEATADPMPASSS